MSAEDVVLVDVDGTVALVAKGPDARRFYDWERVGEDLANEPVVAVVRALAGLGRPVFLTGRSEVCRAATEAWLAKQGWSEPELYMRAEGDYREGWVVKCELYEAEIRRRGYVVRVALDDDAKVVAAWRSKGLAVLQVAG